MKIIIKYGILFSFFAMPCALAQHNNIQGFWEFADYKAKIDVSCECTAEENATLTQDIYKSLKAETDYYMISDYVEFLENDKVEGTIMDIEVDGDYTQDGKTINITHEDDSYEVYELITTKNGDRKLVNHVVGNKENPVYVRSFESSDYGWVEVAILSYSIILNEMQSTD